ncbi:hypothetical protein E2C01_012010 [Portunus trituberculatus]|uniref:Uncharacterized protein n=1 Tax=Portunus trituberculatus TaxID=210409 RepID=A0A5B7DCD0_PORTR|nr:hypothetical protein [Portunus trituberculatus]
MKQEIIDKHERGVRCLRIINSLSCSLTPLTPDSSTTTHTPLLDAADFLHDSNMVHQLKQLGICEAQLPDGSTRDN